MLDKNREKPRLIPLLTVLLVLQAPLIMAIGLNLITDHWTFLYSWEVFWEDLREAFSMFWGTPGEIEQDETLFYDVLAFGTLCFAAIGSIASGMMFRRGGVFPWILSLIVQILIMITGVGLYFVYQPFQAYGLMVVGILMTLYLNFGDVREWFLQRDQSAQREEYA